MKEEMGIEVNKSEEEQAEDERVMSVLRNSCPIV
jgi:hypothetical protein